MLKKVFFFNIIFYKILLFSINSPIKSAVEPLAIIAANFIINNQIKISNTPKEDLENYLEEFLNNKKLPVELLELLAKTFFYQTGQVEFDSAIKRDKFFLNLSLDYGFSIQELIDHNLLPKNFFKIFSSICMNLQWLRINSLVGLLNIFDVNNITILILADNKLKKITSNAFDSCRNLEILNLKNNKLRIIENKAFNNLEKLTEINLENNNLKELKRRSFTNLINFSKLCISNNKIHDKYIYLLLKNYPALQVYKDNKISLLRRNTI